MKILIRQARPVDAAGGVGNLTDLLIDDGMIAAMGPELEVEDAQVIEAKGLVVSAGLVDMHVHLRQPGFEYKETIFSGALSAAAGGLTAMASKPNTRPVIDETGGVG